MNRGAAKMPAISMSRFLVLSLAAHLLFLTVQSVLNSFYSVPQFAVVNAPSSIDVVIIEETPQPVPVPEEKIEAILSALPEVKEVIPQEVVEKLPPEPESFKPPLPVEKPFPEKKATLKSAAQQGALAEAKPDYLINPAPRYPLLARQKGWQGLVVIKVIVNNKGDPIYLEIEQSSGYDILDKAAVKAIRGWRFYPGQLGGVAVESSVRIPVRFELEGVKHSSRKAIK